MSTVTNATSTLLATLLLCMATQCLANSHFHADAVRAWEMRSKNTSTFSATYSGTQVYPKGSQRPGFPPIDTVVSMRKNTLLVADYDPFAIRRTTAIVDLDKLQTSEEAGLLTTTFNQTASMQLLAPNDHYGMGRIHTTSNQYKDIGDMTSWPLTLSIRATDSAFSNRPWLAGDLSEIEGELDGEEVVIFNKNGFSMTVVPRMNWSIVRLTSGTPNAGKMHGEIRVEYHNGYGDSEEWLPSKWRVVFFNPDGSVMSDLRAEVDHIAVNQGVDKGSFSIGFPPNTLVHDHRTDEMHIVLSKDEVRRITRDERNRQATYDQLLASDEGEAGLVGSERSNLSWGLIILNVVIAAILGWLFLRRKM